MGLPTVAKTWQFNVNNVNPPGALILNTNRTLLRTLKNALTGFASSPWEVVYSCGGGVAGTVGDGVDRWSSDTDLVWSTSSHSWIVLKQPGMGNFQVCIDLSNSNAASATIVVSVDAGFTGGTTTARPTAADQIIILSNTTWGPSSGNYGSVLHVMMSDDGESTRIIVCQWGTTGLFANFSKVVNPSVGWATPYVFSWKGTTSTTPAESTTYALYNDQATLNAHHAGTSFTLYLATAGYISATIGENLSGSPNEIDGSYPMSPVSLVSTTTGVRGKHGALGDVWAGYTSLPTGTCYPSGGTRQFVQFGHLIFPWNGTYPKVTL